MYCRYMTNRSCRKANGPLVSLRVAALDFLCLDDGILRIIIARFEYGYWRRLPSLSFVGRGKICCFVRVLAVISYKL